MSLIAFLLFDLGFIFFVIGKPSPETSALSGIFTVIIFLYFLSK